MVNIHVDELLRAHASPPPAIVPDDAFTKQDLPNPMSPQDEHSMPSTVALDCSDHVSMTSGNAMSSVTTVDDTSQSHKT